MSDILPPMHGPQVDKILGKGSIALISDECLYALQPTRVNGVDGCIVLRVHHSRNCANVHLNINMREKLALLRELSERGDYNYMTYPECTRSLKDSWSTAGKLLLALANATYVQANKSSNVCDVAGVKTGAKKKAKKKAKAK